MTRVTALLAAVLATAAAAETEKIRNAHALVFEDTLAPGESRSFGGELPAVTVYTTQGSIGIAGAASTVRSGEVKFAAPGPVTLKNTGSGPLRFVRVEFPGKGSDETWGNTGIPHYQLLLENRYARIYNIKVAAGATEPMHTHKDRVVICLSGATIVHTTPEGRSEPATLTTGQIDWRAGATHVGHNTGKTDLWVVAIEPK